MIECSFALNGKPMSDLRLGGISVPAFSGLGTNVNRLGAACIADSGPIPLGDYYIFDRESGGLLGAVRDRWNHRSEWFALHAIDSKIDDEMFCNEVKRGAFRMHPKGSAGISRGCITIEMVDRLSIYQLRTPKPASCCSTGKLLESLWKGKGPVKRVIHSILLVLWTLLMAVTFAMYLFNSPSVLGLLPQSFWHYLVLTLDAKNAEEIADVEIMVALVFSFLSAALMTYFSVQVWRKIRRSQNQ